jgi:hypothetical protein
MNAEPERILLTTIDQSRFPRQEFARELMERLTHEGIPAAVPHRTAERKLKEPAGKLASNGALLSALSHGETKWVADRPTSLRRRRVSLLLAVAAVICLLLAGAVALSLGPEDSLPERVIPAAIVQNGNEPANTAEITSHFSGSINPDLFESPVQADWNRVYMHYMELDAGASYVTDTEDFTCCHGITVTMVLNGELVIDSEGVILIYRAGPTSIEPETVGTGTSAIMLPGDVFVHAMHIPVLYQNDEEKPATYLNAFLFNLPSGTVIGNLKPAGYYFVSPALTHATESVTSGPIAASVDRVVFESGQELTIQPSENSVMFTSVTEGTLRMTRIDAEGKPAVGLPSLVQSAPRISVAEVSPGEHMLIENESEEPAVLYVFRFGTSEDVSG